jgi:hypothetical protein
MSESLCLKIAIDEDGSAELFASVKVNGFCGHGSAWIGPDELSELGAKLATAFPLKESLGICGGYWSSSEPGELSQEHLALLFYPVSARGTVGCQVRLASPVQPSERPASRNLVQVELLTSYEYLQQFAETLVRLAGGQAPEAVLHAIAA